jgi:hypothetical protein
MFARRGDLTALEPSPPRSLREPFVPRARTKQLSFAV